MGNKILCVSNVFYNHEHIFCFFDSIYREYIDYVILENYSKNSHKIEEYFKDKRIIKHLRSKENITHGTVDYFFKNYKELVKSYDYLILTDGDLLLENIDSYIEEAKSILEIKPVLACGISLDESNIPVAYHPEAIDWIHKGPIIDNKYMEAPTGTHMVLFKKENFDIIFEIEKIIDAKMCNGVFLKDGKWAKSIINKARHLTWDYYYPGNEYYEYKRQNSWVQGTHNKLSEIEILR